MSLFGFSIAELSLIAEVLDEGSIREVARRHSCAPGNVSRLLQRVEAACGETLAVRSRTGIRPTEAGRRLLTTIASVTEQARSFSRSGDAAAPLCGIAAVPFINTHVVAAALGTALGKLRSRLKIRLIDVSPDDILSASLRGACDVCVHIGRLDWPKSWGSVELGTLTWRMYSRAGSASVDAGFIYPVYWGQNGFNYGNDMHPIPLSRRTLAIGVSSAEAAARLLLENYGMVGFLPDVVAREYVDTGRLLALAESPIVSQPAFLTVKTENVSARLQRELSQAVRQHLF